LITIITALKLIRYNTDSEVAAIIQEAIDEIDRLTRVEKHAIDLAKAALEGPGAIDREAAWNVINLSKTEMAEHPSNADWQVLNKAAR
jgi:hypothetical protein